jgi:hypothetical protein
MKTLQQAHAAGRRDGEEGLGPLAPRNGPPGSHAHAMHAAYMQSYRDSLIARVGLPERRHAPRGKNARRPAHPRKPMGAPARKSPAPDYFDFVSGQAKPAPAPLRELRSEFAAHRALRGRNPRRKAKAPRRRKTKARRAKTVTTITRSKVIRRTNPALVALYASKPGMKRLKYLGRSKFGERGRAVLFRTVAEGNAAGRILRDAFPQALRGWTVSAGTEPVESAGPRPHRRRLTRGADPADSLYRDKARRDAQAAHRWLAKQPK